MGHVSPRLCRERKKDSNQFRNVSDACHSTSWLDNFICSHSIHSMVVDLLILDNCPSFDHLPIGLGISTAVTIRDIIHISESFTCTNNNCSNRQHIDLLYI